MRRGMEPKDKITISLDAGLIRRVDAVAGARGESRSRVMERLMENGIDDEERWVDEAEMPLYQIVADLMTSDHRVLRAVAKICGEHMGEKEAREIKAAWAKQKGLATDRRKGKARSRRSGVQGV